MNRELELLVLAYDAMLEAQQNKAKALARAFDSRVDDALERHPSLSRETLGRMILLAHRNWVHAKKSRRLCHQRLSHPAN